MELRRIEEIYDQLPTFVITLDPDPITRGPRHLADLIAQCRNYLNLVGLMQTEVHREKHTLSRDLMALESAFQVSFDEHLANDSRVRALPSIEDRKATVNLFLREERQRIDVVRRALQDLELVDKAIRHRHKELTSTMSEIKLQRSLIQAEIHTGSMYGDEREGRGRGVSVEDSSDPVDNAALDEALRLYVEGSSEEAPAAEEAAEEALDSALEDLAPSVPQMTSTSSKDPSETPTFVTPDNDDSIESFLSDFEDLQPLPEEV